MSIETQGKSLVDLLDMLEPAPVPPPVAMVPQTWGWAVLGLVLLALSLAIILRALKRHRANAYRRAALAELSEAGDDAATIAAILRRTALVAFPRTKVAGLYGQDWINFLTEHVVKNDLSEKSLGALLTAPYAGSLTDPDLTRFARHWIQSHKAGGDH